MLPSVAHAEVLAPHPVQPEFVTPHAAPAVSPAAGGPSDAAPPAEPSAGPVPSPTVSPVASPDPGSPSLDGPKPKPKQPNPDKCQPKPGKVCPYFCPHGKAGSNCKPPEPREPWEREPIQTVDEYMQTVHLCAGAIEVLILGNFIEAFAVNEPYEKHEAFLEASGAKAARVEAWSMFERYNCQTFVMP
jgi:hypothetical protein